MNKRAACIGLIAIISIGAGILAANYLMHHANIPNKPAGQSAETKRSGNTAQKNSFDKTRLSHTDPASLWVVVNKQHPLLPKAYVPSGLQPVGNGQQLRAEAAEALAGMFADAKTIGYSLTAASSYRSYETQISVYNNEVRSYGQERADTESARPGYSEHQTGLAVDIAGGGCNIEDCFGETAEGKWAAANAYKYGYILRYNTANTAITGYRAEPWHFRYVGTELAAELQTANITTLEEFFGVSGGSVYN